LGGSGSSASEGPVGFKIENSKILVPISGRIGRELADEIALPNSSM
jgi:hypothetical protein